MTDRELMQQALEGLRKWRWGNDPRGADVYIAALSERLAQPEPENDYIASIIACREVLDAQPVPPRTEPVQEPVWIQPNHLQKARIAPYLCRVEPAKRDDFVPLYTAPPQRRPLSDEQMWELWNSQGDDAMEQQEAIAFARAIEAAHGIK